MIDTAHPIVQRLVASGFEISLHAYLRDGRTKLTVAAKNRNTGELFQGWSAGDQAQALRDLAHRSGMLADPDQGGDSSGPASDP